jgi:hypothetical protein
MATQISGVAELKSKSTLFNLSLNELKVQLGFYDAGLNSQEAEKRLQQFGFNEIAREKPLSALSRTWKTNFIYRPANRVLRLNFFINPRKIKQRTKICPIG